MRETMKRAAFLEIAHPNPQMWIVRVLLYTDIPDIGFLKGAKETIESVWYVRDENEELRVEIDLHVLSTQDIYGDEAAPSIETHLDIEK